ncbi:MAG: MaoC family dehydratase N-terminal domain-containing protein [Burkholderiaceae bacterium]|nr:MaoC family dehydratase N-terminal domain-containing protein [Burkholderiaceae bacterium]MDO9089556.1 MaoC family dehydratase N-terminal domain-containing protein [Burkholderiaceae bacterium]MDP1968400.1 MaoC family dehydratase N-terminal domain-containing protein [Burkholderiaceae bacterium]
MTEIDRSLIGQFTEPYIVEIEKGAIAKFADAIGDPNPLYRDEAYARRHGYASIPAPPTYPTTFLPPLPPWLANLDMRRLLAGGMTYDYAKPIVAGMRLSCRVRFVGVDDKQGSKGRMSLIRQQIQGHDETGELIYTANRTTAYRAQVQFGNGEKT